MPHETIYLTIPPRLGVAPRVKMNQQRARHFRAAQESTEKHVLRTERVRVLNEAGKSMAERDKKHSFNSNCITPGTEFMARLSGSLRVYITNRISNNEAAVLKPPISHILQLPCPSST